MESWATWILNNPGPGRKVKSLATLALPTAVAKVPNLDIPTSTLSTGVPGQWQPAADRYTSDARKRFFVYNGHRPGSGTFATEDDGVALRMLPWAQYKKHINRWFYWESTYYNNYQGNTKQFNTFQSAQTFGNGGTSDPIKGQTGWNYGNGDGVLFYPGTDVLFPSDSYGVDGPFASLRLKQWRRGLQDAEYLTMAAAVSPAAVNTLVNSIVPKVLWDYGVSDSNDPTWVKTDVSWPVDPDKWEGVRYQLAGIASGAAPSAVAGTNVDNVRVFPNPWRKDKHNGFPVTFSNVPDNSEIKIFTVSAHEVRKLTVSSGGNVTWDLNNESGDRVGSGLYLYLVKTADGHQTRGKLALIR